MNYSTHNYKDLIVWQKGIELAKRIYALTRTFPNDEKFGLTSQMRRAAVSVPSNIAEGQVGHTTGEFIQFLSHAKASTAERGTQIILAVELNFCSKADALPLYKLNDEIRRMLNALRRVITRRR